MLSGNQNKVKISISGTDEDKRNLRRSVVLKSKAFGTLSKNSTPEEAIAVARGEVSRLIQEFRRTKNLAALDAAAVLISSYGLSSSELETALNEDKNTKQYLNYYENIDARILQQMMEYDNFIATLSNRNDTYKKAEELKKRTEDILDKIEQNPVEAEKRFNEIRTDFLKTEEASLNDSINKVGVVAANLKGAEQMKEEAIKKKSNKKVVERIDNQIKQMKEHKDKELDKAWGDLTMHSMNKVYEKHSDLSAQERMAKVKADHEASAAIKESGKLLLEDLYEEHYKSKKGAVKPADIYADARLQQLKSEYLQRQSPPIYQEPSAVRAANLDASAVANLRPVD